MFENCGYKNFDVRKKQSIPFLKKLKDIQSHRSKVKLSF